MKAIRCKNRIFIVDNVTSISFCSLPEDKHGNNIWFYCDGIRVNLKMYFHDDDDADSFCEYLIECLYDDLFFKKSKLMHVDLWDYSRDALSEFYLEKEKMEKEND